MESSTRTDEAPVTSPLEPRVDFESGAWAQGTPMAIAFQDALREALQGADAARIRVRCSVTRDERQMLRFMCKVEYAGGGETLGVYPWSWWSPLVERPDELIAELRRALRLRRERMTAAPPRPLRAPRADKARGPSHDTWTTAPWDLGRSVRSDNFCRNRRGRWTGHSAAAKPFRPRSPR